MKGRALATALVSCFVAFAAWAADPGGEFQISHPAQLSYLPDVAIDPDGDFLVVWGTADDGIHARRYDADGASKGGDFQAGTSGGHYIFSIHAAADPDGFSVVWHNDHKYYGGSSSFRRLGRNGLPRAKEAYAGAGALDVATDVHGKSMVVNGVSAFRYDRLGRPAGKPFHVADLGASNLTIARGREGGFVVAWRAAEGIFARLINTLGGGSPAFRVTTSPFASPPALASDSLGRFAVAWGSPQGVRLRLYSAGGAPRTGVLRVTEDPIDVGQVSVAMDAAGKVLVVWGDCPVPYSVCHAMGRRYESTGAPAGGPFVIDSSGKAISASAAGGPSGHFVVVWQSYGNYGEISSVIFGRRLAWARDGDAPCVRRGNRILCDAAHDGGEEEIARSFGSGGDRFLLGDLDGDGRDDPCVYRGGRFLCDTAQNGGAAEIQIPFGQDGDQPLLADLDGEGRDDPCVRRGDLLLCDSAHNGGTAELVVPFGLEEDVFLMGDVDGDGDDDPCVARSTVLLCDTEHDGDVAEVVLPFPVHGDTVLLGDLDADGRDDPCLYRDGHFLCDTRHEGEPDLDIRFGAPSDLPILGDLDGR